MAEITHTRGPWKQEGDRWQKIIADDPEQPGEPWCICDVADYVGHGDPHTESQANARLIVAAPDLLEALKALPECPECGTCMLPDATSFHDSDCLVGAAIAKATGQ